MVQDTGYELIHKIYMRLFLEFVISGSGGGCSSSGRQQ